MTQNKKIEKELKKRLKKETEEVTKLKDKTWNKISKQLFPINIKSPETNRGKRFVVALSTVAVVTIMAFGLLTGIFTDESQNGPNQGANDPDNTTEDLNEEPDDPKEHDTLLKDQFVHEKQIDIELEGQKEQVNVQLATNEELRYIIYFDKDRYQFKAGETSDRINANTEFEDQISEIFMEIIHEEVMTKKETVSAIKQEFYDLDMEITFDEEVTTPLEAYKISATGKGKTGSRDAPIHEYYVLQDEMGQLFVIKQVFFLEGAEGHGSRFDAMLESFEVVK